MLNRKRENILRFCLLSYKGKDKTNKSNDTVGNYDIDQLSSFSVEPKTREMTADTYYYCNTDYSTSFNFTISFDKNILVEIYFLESALIEATKLTNLKKKFYISKISDRINFYEGSTIVDYILVSNITNEFNKGIRYYNDKCEVSLRLKNGYIGYVDYDDTYLSFDSFARMDYLKSIVIKTKGEVSLDYVESANCETATLDEDGDFTISASDNLSGYKRSIASPSYQYKVTNESDNDLYIFTMNGGSLNLSNEKTFLINQKRIKNVDTGEVVNRSGNGLSVFYLIYSYDGIYVYSSSGTRLYIIDYNQYMLFATKEASCLFERGYYWLNTTNKNGQYHYSGIYIVGQADYAYKITHSNATNCILYSNPNNTKVYSEYFTEGIYSEMDLLANSYDFLFARPQNGGFFLYNSVTGNEINFSYGNYYYLYTIYGNLSVSSNYRSYMTNSNPFNGSNYFKVVYPVGSSEVKYGVYGGVRLRDDGNTHYIAEYNTGTYFIDCIITIKNSSIYTSSWNDPTVKTLKTTVGTRTNLVFDVNVINNKYDEYLISEFDSSLTFGNETSHRGGGMRTLDFSLKAKAFYSTFDFANNTRIKVTVNTTKIGNGLNQTGAYIIFTDDLLDDMYSYLTNEYKYLKYGQENNIKSTKYDLTDCSYGFRIDGNNKFYIFDSSGNSYQYGTVSSFSHVVVVIFGMVGSVVLTEY